MTPNPPRTRWTSFVADPGDGSSRIQHEQGNPPTAYAWSTTETRSSYISSDEDGEGRTVLAVDRGARWVVAQARQQVDVAEDAYSRLYGDA